MPIDWEGKTTEVLLNPRISERDNIRKLILSANLDNHIWLTTSGTTGRFKFVALSREAILCSAKAVNTHLNSDQKDIWLHNLPDFHVGGVGIQARSFLSGAKVVDAKKEQPKWDPHLFCSIANKAQATLSALVPTQVYDLVVHELTAPKSLCAVIVGGGALSKPIYDRAHDLGWPLLPSYGLTECASQVVTARLGECEKGTVLSHVSIRIDDEGFIQVKSPSLLTTYAFIEDNKLRLEDPKINGWFMTEDKGALFGGCLKVFGRASDFVKIGGEGVNLLHLRGVLQEIKYKHAITQEMALLARPDERLGHVINLVIEGRSSGEVESIIEDFNAQVMPYERIRSHHLVPEIPRSSLGKILFPTSGLNSR